MSLMFRFNMAAYEAGFQCSKFFCDLVMKISSITLASVGENTPKVRIV